MVDLKAICEVSDSGAPFVGMCHNDDLMASINEFGRELVYVAFNSS